MNASGVISGVVDVTRCQIVRPRNAPWSFYSAKDKFHALKYEVVCSPKKPVKIIWLSEPYAGSHSDITIYRHRLKWCLDEDEYLLADKGYVGASHIIHPYKGRRLTPDQKRINWKISRVRQKIERINKRIKDWRLASRCWRSSDHHFHYLCMKVICKLVNIMLKEEPL